MSVLYIYLILTFKLKIIEPQIQNYGLKDFDDCYFNFDHQTVFPNILIQNNQTQFQLISQQRGSYGYIFYCNQFSPLFILQKEQLIDPQNNQKIQQMIEYFDHQQYIVKMLYVEKNKQINIIDNLRKIQNKVQSSKYRLSQIIDFKFINNFPIQNFQEIFILQKNEGLQEKQDKTLHLCSYQQNDQCISTLFILQQRNYQSLKKITQSLDFQKHRQYIFQLQNQVQYIGLSLQELDIFHFDLKPGNIMNYEPESLSLFLIDMDSVYHEPQEKCIYTPEYSPCNFILYISSIILGIQAKDKDTYCFFKCDHYLESFQIATIFFSLIFDNQKFYDIVYDYFKDVEIKNKFSAFNNLFNNLPKIEQRIYYLLQKMDFEQTIKTNIMEYFEKTIFDYYKSLKNDNIQPFDLEKSYSFYQNKIYSQIEINQTDPSYFTANSYYQD